MMTLTSWLVKFLASGRPSPLTPGLTLTACLCLSLCQSVHSAWEDPDTMLEGACEEPKKDGRTPCRMMYLFITKQANYRRGMQSCQVYNASIATFSTEKQISWASLHPINFDKNSDDKFFVGAKKFERGFYRWENGLLQTSQGDLEQFFHHTEYQSDDDRPDQCLILTKDKEFKPVHCNSPNGVICERCIVPRPPLSKCGGFCVGSDGNIECKTYVNECPVNMYMGRSTDVCSTLPCAANRWGERCEKICFCAGGVACNILTGECPKREGKDRCMDPWVSEACNESICEPTQWSPTCTQNCSCQHGQACRINSGDCPTGCLPGAFGRYCQKTKCPPGKYGPGCNKNCHCLEIGRLMIGYCSQVDGICLTVPGRCQHGWFGRSCNLTQCPDGYYGMDRRDGPRCLRACHCLHGNCHPITGQCYSRCTPGWLGPACGRSVCPLNKWHVPDCAVNCSYKCKGGGCDPVTGRCLNQRYWAAVEARKAEACPNKGTGLTCTDGQCEVNCKRCDRWDDKKCYECKAKYEVDIWTHKCVRTLDHNCTDPLCMSCKMSDPYHCEECRPGYSMTLHLNCKGMCPDRMWGEGCNKICEMEHCQRCHAYNHDQCTECTAGHDFDESGKCASLKDVAIDVGFTEVIEEISISPFVLLVFFFPSILISAIIYQLCNCHKIYDVEKLMATAHPEGQLKRQLKRKKKQAMRQARRAKGQAARAKDQRGQGQWVRSQDQGQDKWRQSIAGIRMRAKVTKAMGQKQDARQKSPESAARDELFKTII